ncbi:MAG: ABC transporter permease, partial [Thermoanaerobaculia bacterium]|nr:ABC transporter permease [Thermoanaerobaculia bacterium]
MMLGEGAQAGDVAALRTELGLDRPLLAQYAAFVAGLARGDLGQSLHFDEPVATLIARHYPATALLAAAALASALALALPLGMLAAYFRDGWIDRFARLFSLAGVAIPNFWLGPMAMVLFSIHPDLLPVSGSAGWQGPGPPAATRGRG